MFPRETHIECALCHESSAGSTWKDEDGFNSPVERCAGCEQEFCLPDSQKGCYDLHECQWHEPTKFHCYCCGENVDMISKKSKTCPPCEILEGAIT